MSARQASNGNTVQSIYDATLYPRTLPQIPRLQVGLDDLAGGLVTAPENDALGARYMRAPYFYIHDEDRPVETSGAGLSQPATASVTRRSRVTGTGLLKISSTGQWSLMTFRRVCSCSSLALEVNSTVPRMA